MAEKKTSKKASTPKVKKEKTEETIFLINETYKVEALKGNKHLIEGKVYEVSGEIAKILIDRGLAKLVQ